VLQIGLTLGLSLHVDLICELVRIAENFPNISLEGRPFPISEIPGVDGCVWIELKGSGLATVMVMQVRSDNLVLAGLFAHLAQQTPCLRWLASLHNAHR